MIKGYLYQKLGQPYTKSKFQGAIRHRGLFPSTCSLFAPKKHLNEVDVGNKLAVTMKVVD